MANGGQSNSAASRTVEKTEGKLDYYGKFCFVLFFVNFFAISFGRSVSDVSGAVAAAHLPNGKVFVPLFSRDRRQVDESSPGKYYRLRAMHTTAFEIYASPIHLLLLLIWMERARVVVSGCVGMWASANAVATHAPNICQNNYSNWYSSSQSGLVDVAKISKKTSLQLTNLSSSSRCYDYGDCIRHIQCKAVVHVRRFVQNGNQQTLSPVRAESKL